MRLKRINRVIGGAEGPTFSINFRDARPGIANSGRGRKKTRAAGVLDSYGG